MHQENATPCLKPGYINEDDICTWKLVKKKNHTEKFNHLIMLLFRLFTFLLHLICAEGNIPNHFTVAIMILRWWSIISLLKQINASNANSNQTYPSKKLAYVHYQILCMSVWLLENIFARSFLFIVSIINIVMTITSPVPLLLKCVFSSYPPTTIHRKRLIFFWNFPLIKNYKEKKVGFHHSTHTTCRHDDDCYDEALNFTRSKSSHHRIVAVVVIFYVLLRNKCTMTDIIIMTSLSWFMIVLYEYPFVLLIPWYYLVHSFLIWWKC